MAFILKVTFPIIIWKTSRKRITVLWCMTINQTSAWLSNSIHPIIYGGIPHVVFSLSSIRVSKVTSTLLQDSKITAQTSNSLFRTRRVAIWTNWGVIIETTHHRRKLFCQITQGGEAERGFTCWCLENKCWAFQRQKSEEWEPFVNRIPREGHVWKETEREWQDGVINM